MSGSMSGADIEALRLLADKFDEGSETLDTVATAVEAATPQEDGWSGPDADGFRQEWTGSHLTKLRDAAAALSDAALTVRANADAQETTSNEYNGGGPGGWPGGGELGNDGGFDWTWGVAGTLGALGLKGFTTYLAASKGWKTGSALVSLVQAKRLGDLAAIADATTEVYRGAGGLVGRTAASLGVAEDFGMVGRLSGLAGLGSHAASIARFTGVAGGVFGIYGGYQQLTDSQYDGVRGGVDQFMGGLSMVGGAGGIAIALGGAALLGPVGVGVVVGAGLIAGAWSLGNMVYDNWDTISGAAGDAAGWVADGWNATTGAIGEGIGNAAEAAGDVVSDVGDAVGDGLEAAGDFVGGLFS